MLDTAFGTGGLVKIDFDGFDDVATKIAIQPDGKLVIAGHSDNGTRFRKFLVRLNSDGTYDTPFANLGIKMVDVGASHAHTYAMTLQPDGKIVAGGHSSNTNQDFSVMRCHP